MKNIKILKVLLPTTLVLSSLPLATITSCGDKSGKDFASFDKVQKDVYGTYDQKDAYTSVATFNGFELKDGYSIDDLVVSVENCEFEGFVSAYTEQTNAKTFSVKVLFQSETILYGQKTKFDLALSHKSSKEHIQRLTGLSVEFVFFTIHISAQAWDNNQTLYTSQTKLSYVHNAIFTAVTSEGEEIEDLSNFYIETTCFSDTLIAEASIVPLYDNMFAIKLSLDNITETEVPIVYTIRNKRMPLWYQNITFALTMSHDLSKGYKFNKADGTITRCDIQDANITIPNQIDGVDVKVIDNYSFANCINLRQLTFPETVVTISPLAFRNTYIESFKVNANNANYTSIANGSETGQIMVKPASGEPTTLFRGCAYAKIPETIKTIGANAYFGCFNLQTIAIPDSVEEINKDAFTHCINLVEINLNKTKILHGYAFDDCASLKEINLGTELQEIIGHTFIRCKSLRSLTIPATVTKISDTSLMYCNSLQDLKVAEGNQTFTSKDSNGNECHSIMTKDGSKILHGCSNSVIPNGIQSIGAHCFHSAQELKSINIPSTVTTIESNAFDRCLKLESIDISNVTTLEDHAFWGCSSLNEVKLSPDLTEIDERTFENCYSLESIKIPEKCTTIRANAFATCALLNNVEGIEKITELGSSAFTKCYSLKSISLPNLTKLGKSVFDTCISLESVDLLNSKITAILDDCFTSCTLLQEVKLPASDITIGKKAFYEDKALKTIDLSNATTIGVQAFANCSALEKVDLSKATRIDSSAFASCTSLAEIKLSESLTNIGINAFNSNTSLKSITIPASVTLIQGGAFNQCTSLSSAIFNNPKGWKQAEQEIPEADLKDPAKAAEILKQSIGLTRYE